MHLEEELILDLSAPVRSFRLFALEQLLRKELPFSVAVRETLSERERTEDDPECRQLLGYVLERLTRRPADRPGASNSAAGPALAARYLKLPAGERMSFLQDLPAELIRDSGDEGFLMLRREEDPLLQASLIRVFGSELSPARLDDLLGFLEAPCLSLRMSALETLVRRSPKTLLQQLPRLLTSDDPRGRALAVQGLATIDLEEALSHLDLLLESPDPNMVLAALRNSIFFPWDRIKPSLLKGLSLQRDSRVLGNIGLVLQNNPDPEIPFRLWSMLGGISPEKRILLEDILQKSLQAIASSGILGDRFAEYLARHQNWTRQQKTTCWLRDVLRLIEIHPDCLTEIEAGLLPRLDQPDIRMILQEALGWPLPPEVSSHLRRWLAGRPPVGEAVAPKAAAPQASAIQPGEGTPSASLSADFREWPLVEQIRALGAYDPAARQDGGDVLETVLALADPSPDLLATAMRTALRVGDRRFLEVARSALRSANPSFLAAGIEYLGTLDVDSLLPYLGRFLTATDPRIAGAVLKIWRNLDITQGLATLGRLLDHPSRETRRAGLAGMIYFDFVAVRPLLLAFLLKSREGEDSLFTQALFFFAANPETDNLYGLYCLEKALAGRGWKGKAAQVAAVAAGNADFLLASRQIDGRWLEGRLARFEARMAEEEKQAGAVPPPYSRKVLRPDGPTPLSIRLTVPRQKAALALGGLLLVAVLWLQGLPPELPAGVPKNGAVLSGTISRTGRVTQAAPRGIALQTPDGRQYLLLPPPGGTFAGIEPGSTLRASFLPFRMLGTDTYKAQCLSFQK